MGFNNGYESGYDDAKAESAQKIKTLEARIAELEASGASGSGVASSPGLLSAVILVGDDIQTQGDWDTSTAFLLYGPGTERFDPAAGDKVEIRISDDSDLSSSPWLDLTPYVTKITKRDVDASFGTYVGGIGILDDVESIPYGDTTITLAELLTVLAGDAENLPNAESCILWARLTIGGAQCVTNVYFTNN